MQDANTHTPDGYFILIPSELLAQYKRGILLSPPLDGGAYTTCFSFSYFAYGTDIDTPVLNLLIKDLTNGQTILFEGYNTTVRAVWNRVVVSIPKIPYRFSIELSTVFINTPLETDIALDYFVLDDSCDEPNRPTTPTVPLPERKWDCNFEYLCKGWILDSSWNITSYHNSMYTLI